MNTTPAASSPQPSSAKKRKSPSPIEGSSSSSSSSSSPSVSEWSVAEVCQWLLEQNLAMYSSSFRANDVDGAALLALDKQDLVALGVGSVGHRARLVLALDALRVRDGVVDASKKRNAVKKIAIEGNIAAGKTTFLRLLSENLEFVVVPEPISKWQNVVTEEDAMSSSQVSGGNLLQMFYDDPKRWGYTFQTYAFLSRMRAQMQPIDYFLNSASECMQQRRSSPLTVAPAAEGGDAVANAADDDDTSSPRTNKRRKQFSADRPTLPKVQFFERSVFSDRFCFAANCFETSLFNEVEWNTYCDWHTWLTDTFSSLRLDGLVYLRTDPNTCMSRLQRRARNEEKTVSLEYLQSIHARHEEWLMDNDDSDDDDDEDMGIGGQSVAAQIKNAPLLVIDSDQEFERDPARAREMKELVANFVASL